MAISKAKKETLVADLTALLADAKLTAYARYQGLTVADLQDLRRAAREATGTPLANPFLALAFLPLPVIPEARLTLGGFIHV